MRARSRTDGRASRRAAASGSTAPAVGVRGVQQRHRRRERLGPHRGARVGHELEDDRHLRRGARPRERVQPGRRGQAPAPHRRDDRRRLAVRFELAEHPRGARRHLGRRRAREHGPQRRDRPRSGLDERIAGRGALARPARVVPHAERLHDDAHGVGRRDPPERAEGREAQRGRGVRHEGRDRVDGVGGPHAAERRQRVAPHVVVLVPQREHQGRRGARVAQVPQRVRDGLPHVRRRVLHLAHERHDGALIPEAREGADDLDAHGGRRIVEATEERGHRVARRLVAEGLRRRGPHFRVGIAERPRERRHDPRVRQGAGDLARLAPQPRVRRVEPRGDDVRGARGAQADRGVGGRQTHLVVPVAQRAERERRPATGAELRELLRRRSARRRIRRLQVALHALRHVGPDERARGRGREQHERRDPQEEAMAPHASHDSPPRRRAIQCTPRRTAAPSVHTHGGATGATWRSALTTVGLGSGSDAASAAEAKTPPVARASAFSRAGSGRESAHSSPPASHAKSYRVVAPSPTRSRAV